MNLCSISESTRLCIVMVFLLVWVEFKSYRVIVWVICDGRVSKVSNHVISSMILSLACLLWVLAHVSVSRHTPPDSRQFVLRGPTSTRPWLCNGESIAPTPPIGPLGVAGAGLLVPAARQFPRRRPSPASGNSCGVPPFPWQRAESVSKAPPIGCVCSRSKPAIG